MVRRRQGSRCRDRCRDRTIPRRRSPAGGAQQGALLLALGGGPRRRPGARRGAGSAAEEAPRRRLEALVASVGAYVERSQTEMEAAVLDGMCSSCVQPCCRESRNPGEDPLLAWQDVRPKTAPKVGSLAVSSGPRFCWCASRGGMQVGYRDVYEVEGKTLQDRKRTRPQTLPLGHRGEHAGARQDRRRERVSTSADVADHQPADAAAALSRAGDAPGSTSRAVARRRSTGEDGDPRVPGGREPDVAAASARGIDMPARGRALGGARDRTIRRIELRHVARARRVMNVWFGEDPRIGVLVPTRMWEWYEKILIGDEVPAGASQRLAGRSRRPGDLLQPAAVLGRDQRRGRRAGELTRRFARSARSLLLGRLLCPRGCRPRARRSCGRPAPWRSGESPWPQEEVAPDRHLARTVRCHDLARPSMTWVRRSAGKVPSFFREARQVGRLRAQGGEISPLAVQVHVPWQLAQ